MVVLCYNNTNVFSWRFKRQLLYVVIVLTIIFIPVVIYLSVTAPVPSCFDGIKNQKELGIDCGGGCALVCKNEVSDMKVLWQRAFPVQTGQYDLVALVENPNNDFFAKSFDYKFEIFNSENKVVLEKNGKGFANPRERFIIFEPKIFLGNKSPAHVFLEISNVKWARKPNYIKQQIQVQDQRLIPAPLPRLSATLVNNLPLDIPNVEAVATILSEKDNIIAVSSTKIGTLSSGRPQRIFFTWPQGLPEPPRICIKPVEAVLLFDRSGSMNDDNTNPPQPLSDAQDAAKVFVSQLSSRDKISLVSFGTEAIFPIDQSLTKNLQAVREAISNIIITPEEETGSTNLGEGIERAITELKINGEGIGRQVIIALTDGQANAPGGIKSGESFAKKEAFEAKTNGFEVYTIGLGEKVNKTFLRDDIAGTPNKYYFSKTSRELEQVYTDIAQDVCPERVYLTKIFVRSLDDSF